MEEQAVALQRWVTWMCAKMIPGNEFGSSPAPGMSKCLHGVIDMSLWRCGQTWQGGVYQLKILRVCSVDGQQKMEHIYS